MPTLHCHEIDEQLDGYVEAACEHDRRVSAAIARVERDESLKRHLDELGFPDAESYRQWCRRQGLSTRLAKSPLAREDELDLMRRVDAWRFTPEQHGRLIRLRRFARRGAWDKPRRASEALVVRFATEVVGAEVTARRRYCELVSAFAEGFEPFATVAHIPVWVVEALAYIASEADELVRDPADWEPPDVDRSSSKSADFRSVLRSFVRHVLVKYESPPRWLEAIWFDSDRMGTMWIAAYVEMGRGFSLSHCGLPFEISKRGCHEALNAPRRYPCRAALRFGQARAFGASRARACAIAVCGVHWEDNPFWTSVVQWMATHDDFPADQIGALYDFIKEVRDYKRWVCDARGRWVQASLEPDWKIGGRSARSLLRDIDAVSIEDANANAKVFDDDRPVSRPERVRIPGERETWLVVPVLKEAEFADEGESMSHCVGSYHGAAEDGRLEIYSLRSISGRRAKRRVTICVRPAIGVSEARGFANRAPSSKEWSAIAIWARRRRIPMKMIEL